MDENTTRATARLPDLEIDILHRKSPGDDAEQITINLRAVPSFEAFGQFLGTANPFAIWAQAVQSAWLPWFGLARALNPHLFDLSARPRLTRDERESAGG